MISEVGRQSDRTMVSTILWHQWRIADARGARSRIGVHHCGIESRRPPSLNSENARLPGTFKLYLSYAGMAIPPETMSTTATIAIARMVVRFMVRAFSVKF